MALVSDPSPNAPVFHLPYGLRYECLQDGACCHLDFWDVHVEAEEAERILAKDWKSCSAAPSDSPFAASSRNRDQLILKKMDAKCSFLGADNLCRLQTAHGIDIKPIMCRQFPFRFVQAPDGVYVGLSFVCPSILGNIGAPIEDQFDQIKKDFLVRSTVHRLEHPIRFDAARELAWEDYLLIEQALDEMLACSDHSVGDCLIAGHAWLGILRHALTSRDLPPGLTSSQIIRHYVARSRAESFARPFSISQRRAANGALKRMFLGSFISFRHNLLQRKGRVSVTLAILGENVRHWFRLGTIRLPSVDREFLYSDFRPAASDLADQDMQILLRRYFRHALFRKDIVRHTDVYWGYCYLVLTYGLIQWYAAALKASGESDPRRAVSLVERYYVHHSDFDQLFLHHPALSQTVQYLFNKSNFAHSIVMG